MDALAKSFSVNTSSYQHDDQLSQEGILVHHHWGTPYYGLVPYFHHMCAQVLASPGAQMYRVAKQLGSARFGVFAPFAFNVLFYHEFLSLDLE